MVYAYRSKIYLAEVTLPLRILMALSHGSEKDNKKTANCCFLMRKINSYLVLSQQPKIREGVGRCLRQIGP